MKINKVTITGADNNVDIKDLIRLSELYPFVEWGILFSKSREGMDRYPDQKWIENVTNYNMSLSAHFCGWWAKELLNNKNYELIENLSLSFKRVQLNYNFSNYNIEDLAELLYYIKVNANQNIILQQNNNNNNIIKSVKKLSLIDNVEILYDSSGGRGTELKNIDTPFKYYTGYAGGINKKNIKDICESITTNKSDSTVWIDMESGVRTYGKFDLKKVEKILEVCKNYITIE